MFVNGLGRNEQSYLPPCRREKTRQCISGNPDNFTVSISFEYELERFTLVAMSCLNIDICIQNAVISIQISELNYRYMIQALYIKRAM
jgi:hypothetical protein